MRVCSRCGAEFDLTRAKRRIGRLYGAGIYNEEYPDGDVCGNCAVMEISAAMGTGKEDIENMGSGWDID